MSVSLDLLESKDGIDDVSDIESNGLIDGEICVDVRSGRKSSCEVDLSNVVEGSSDCKEFSEEAVEKVWEGEFSSSQEVNDIMVHIWDIAVFLDRVVEVVCSKKGLESIINIPWFILVIDLNSVLGTIVSQAEWTDHDGVILVETSLKALNETSGAGQNVVGLVELNSVISD